MLMLFSVLSAGAAEIEASFSPRGEALDMVLEVIAKAEKSIHVAAYSFTSSPIAQALLEAHKRGLEVRVVCDKNANSNSYTSSTFLANHNVPVRLNGSYAIMHNKFLVVDGRHVQTGSFNYTGAAAGRNAENVMVVRNSPEIARQYEAEWQRLWDEGNGRPAVPLPRKGNKPWLSL